MKMGSGKYLPVHSLVPVQTKSWLPRLDLNPKLSLEASPLPVTSDAK